MYPKAVSERDFEGFEVQHRAEEEGLVREIVDVCTDMELEVDAGDVIELVDSHKQDLTTEDLQLVLQENENVA